MVECSASYLLTRSCVGHSCCKCTYSSILVTCMHRNAYVMASSWGLARPSQDASGRRAAYLRQLMASIYAFLAACGVQAPAHQPSMDVGHAGKRRVPVH